MRKILTIILLCLFASLVHAQIVIDGHVYGGARQADVKGSASVSIGADYHDVLINAVYGGNDISGTVGTGSEVPAGFQEKAAENGVDTTYNTFVRICPEKETTTGTGDDAVTTQDHHIFIGRLFGGSNGDYDYTSDEYKDKTRPEIDKAYLQIEGGTIAYVYGGGNEATVTHATDIFINNKSDVTISSDIKGTDGTTLLTGDRLRDMGIAIVGDVIDRKDYHFSRVFGGNNKAEMDIQPKWHLQNGKIDNLYSGGNEGRMTSPKGLLLEIGEGSEITVNNLYGGCRKADVRPRNNGADVTVPNLSGYSFPEGLSARVIVKDGNINNVYGGNDVSGKVWGGAAVGIYHSITGSIYGGGNGSYLYTDNENLKNDLTYGDFYYDRGTDSSVKALNAFRPKTESVSIFVKGTSATKPTVIGGAIYCGGNSATLHSDDVTKTPYSELKVGSYVMADQVFLGNNGANLVSESVLEQLAGNVTIGETEYDFSQVDLKNGEGQMNTYMDAVAMDIKPRVVFADDYAEYSTYFGSLFCGGNVGSITYAGANEMSFDDKIIIYDKVVGGCNNANVPASDYNVAYEGGITGDPDTETGNKLVLDFNGLKIQPLRWKGTKDDEGNYTSYDLDVHGNRQLEFNTIFASTGADTPPITSGSNVESTPIDLDRRLKGGNIYGGCYNSGHVNGNVVININSSIVDRKGEHAIFDMIDENEGEAILYDNKESGQAFKILERRSGVILNEQGMDVLGKALNVFGGGYGEDSEIWGSTTINLNAGYVFQIFGGGEKGAIGKGVRNAEGKLEYATYNGKYSTYINLRGAKEGVYRGYIDPKGRISDDNNTAEAEFIYGGGFFGPIAGDTHINLGNGRVFNTFAGSCNADILGHTETYIGRQVKTDGTYEEGFPWVRDHIYGGNDLGGKIMSTVNFMNRVNTSAQNLVYNPQEKETVDVTKASAYVEYRQGRVDYIFGGCYGYYDYTDRHYKDYTNDDGSAKNNFIKPRMDNAFVNFRPNDHPRSEVAKVYGAGQGYSGETDRDVMQDRSYVLIDIPQTMTQFCAMDVFGAGDYSGVGMRVDSEITPELSKEITEANADGVTAAAVIDLVRGQVKDVFGASYKEGVTRRTIVNVPQGSTIKVNNIFGGSYGVRNDKPCDVYEATVNFHSEDALAKNIYGGNNAYRRTLYGRVNIDVPVWQTKKGGYLASVYGAGLGQYTWSQYTEVNLEKGANVYYVFGGGDAGRVLNKETVTQLGTDSTYVMSLGSGYTDEGLENAHVRQNPLGTKTNTNVYINKDATVSNYAFGGGYGSAADVSGTTYIGVHGGLVAKDLYAGGYGGGVKDVYRLGHDSFVATANAYIEGGKVRKVYGGCYEGHVGNHEGAIVDGKFLPTAGSTGGDIDGVANVVIGIRKDQATLPEGYGYYKGVPTIEFNAYGGGEGGSVFGTANLTLNNGYIGYNFLRADQTLDEQGNKVTTETINEDRYVEKYDDETYFNNDTREWEGKNRLTDCGNVFGGGYDDLSTCDFTNVTVWGGYIRNGLFGGGEIATVGRGTTQQSTGVTRELKEIYKHGGTHIKMYNGHVLRNVFGGGKGYNELYYGTGHGVYTDGYVFGQTAVEIHGGEIGTADGVAKGYGNVFGGGDIGYVYGLGTKSNENTGSPGHYYYKKVGVLTEDCKVVVSPYLQVKNPYGTTINGKSYAQYDYVPTEKLNTLQATKDEDGNWTGTWLDLYTGSGKDAAGNDDATDTEERGVHIYNAVFAGGNVSSNSDQTYANASTVFGNTTATLNDVYHRDFITVGTEHVGGLYGGGNLSVVDGYRELNITNYGTDYYGLDDKITLAKYQTLSNRERAYFQLQYVCQSAYTDGNGKEHKKDDKISEEDYNNLPNGKDYWVQYGFCSIYAGRLLNTIQRADLCGVYGSRMVLQGAKDRVADVGDGTVYTINRVGELSLNKQLTVAGDLDDVYKDSNTTPTKERGTHGNYFGIYSVVNYLGHLTSDVKFDDPYRTIETRSGKEVTVEHTGTGETYYQWKLDHLKKKDRNIGTCHNQVALASGVFLELTTEMTTNTKKVYGDITGIVELDLINVRKDISVGGGYVYARNEHGARTYHQEYQNVILSSFNGQATDGSHIEARTFKRYTYDDVKENFLDHETSGNFIHRRKRIVDDCYPNNGVYKDGYVASPAHYWFIKGEVYIYDQTVSAYAGSASAYSKEVKIPLTITAGSEGRLKLLNVQPNLYAYYALGTRDESNKITSEGVKLDNETTIYYSNDVISWWDWQLLPENERKCFVKETYCNADTCYVDGTLYPAGRYALENDASLHDGEPSQTAWSQFDLSAHTYKDKTGKDITDELAIRNLFHPSNNIAHDTGYVLTFDMDTPKDWDDWYTKIESGTPLNDKKRKDIYNAMNDVEKKAYREGPTFRLKSGESSGLYGQKPYNVGEIISKEVYDDYTTTVSRMGTAPTGQAVVEEAYVAKESIGGTQAGSAISQTQYNALPDNSNYAEALVCTSTIQLGTEEYVLRGELVAKSDLTSLAEKYQAYNNGLENMEDIEEDEALNYVNSHLAAAYYCTEEGLYGGQYFEKDQNYSAIKAWCSLTDDRDKFEFNYDALDLLVNSSYPGEGHIVDVYHAPYSDEKPVEYKAAYTGEGTLEYQYEGGGSGSVSSGGTIDREEFERIKNEQRHYTRITVTDDPVEVDGATKNGQWVYISTTNFYDHGTPYAKGQDLTADEYNSLDADNKVNVSTKFVENATGDALVQYYCYEAYSGHDVGDIISADAFSALVNDQKQFVIQGVEPTETTTLYVSRESNAKDVTSEKIISVVYQYTYFENDDEGEGVSLANELHIVNIHLKLESGVPEIGTLSPPAVVLPGNPVNLKKPEVNPGLYEVIINGWEMYTNEHDAESHREGTGTPFVNGVTPVYWYQNQKLWVVFYSKTYLGKTYSNPVPITVANYHDIAEVMADKEHHLYVDYDPDQLLRPSKIYLNDYNSLPVDDPRKGKNGLDELKDFIDLSNGHGPSGHSPLNPEVMSGNKLEFFMRTDISHPESWTSIGSGSDPCFAGTFHGDGYTISGLDHSLFDKLCGDVYNLGVTGSFTSAGVANTGDGYVENCWVKSRANVDSNVKAVFGNPSGDSGTQIVNCYYPETNAYSTASHARGNARKMTEQEFYNGTVAYNLNGFYLNKRYYDKTGTTPSSYDYGNYEYVESRYADGDFIYAGGTIPQTPDERIHTVVKDGETTVEYVPIWPDDYLFFGQRLTYDYDALRPHQSLPSHIAKNDGRLAANDQSNRVYRAPAYFGSENMSAAYFNPVAYLVAYSKPETLTSENKTAAYPGMTAIDFAGHNDLALGKSAFNQGWKDGLFCHPLLDDDGLYGLRLDGQTQNLLVYAPAETPATDGAYANSKTYDVLTNHNLFDEPVYRESQPQYRCVDEAATSSITGHLVPSTLVATNDHLLVDRNDFNCPISYSFDSDYRMWYQRTPDHYVDLSKGWEAVSLPFIAELVTTQQKGEITHFYSGSRSVDEKGTKTGHEYWLREYKGKKDESETDGTYIAAFNYPDATGDSKTVGNTFLWDYYYKENSRQDANTDIYQHYYETERSLAKYPLLANAVPYIIGFPGTTYYEFDLSGQWTPSHTATPVPAKLDKQTITFASNPGDTIQVSDNEDEGTSADGYIFKKNYISKTLAAGAAYIMNSDGNSFDKITAATTTVPFRPYFEKDPAAGARQAASRILFDSDESSFAFGDEDPSKEEIGEGDLLFTVRKHEIAVTSSLRHTADVRIVNVSGVTVANFTIQPSETIERHIPIAGVYIVRADGGRIQKKIALK